MTAEQLTLMDAIATEIKDILTLIFADFSISENIKVKKNTLQHSAVDRTKEVRFKSPFFELIVNDYISYIERGRERWHRPKVPIDALRDWAREKLGKTDNGTLFAVQQSIYKLGIRPRPIFHYFWERLDKKWDERFSDKIFEIITKELDKYFK